MSIPSKTRKDQKAHEHGSHPREKVNKHIEHSNENEKAQAVAGAGAEAGAGEHLTVLSTSVGKHCSLADPHSFATPARSHDMKTKRNRNRFPDWGHLCGFIPLNLRIKDLTN